MNSRLANLHCDVLLVEEYLRSVLGHHPGLVSCAMKALDLAGQNAETPKHANGNSKSLTGSTTTDPSHSIQMMTEDKGDAAEWESKAELRQRLLNHVQGREGTRKPETLRQCFDQHAAQRPDGRLGRAELKAAMASLGKRLVDKEEDLEALFLSMDGDGDGGVDLEEFMRGMGRTSGVESWAVRLELWRPYADALSFFVGGDEDVMRRVSRLSEGEVDAVCFAAMVRACAVMKERVAELRATYGVLDERRAREDGDGGAAKFKTFTAKAGGVDDFFGGLGHRVGFPNPKIMEAMRHEHCTRGGSDVAFETDNYKIRTTPREEWGVVVDGVAVRAEHMGRGRVVRTWATCMAEEGSRGVIEGAGLWEEEGTATILYTGPMYQWYNAALRRPDSDLYRTLSDANNLFATTIFALSSSVQKISRVMRL
eukprot:CAMPEP_0113704466 /NCGR_PEP_ID=MMETSP0038_2-20120614/26537_1 /TAXON_ID=2898 /ORGANISM="Cryptomonas paramecium" /LENGTH=424 /DNA_ID=CAMNT_0000629255 /DNA_START=243 /DNA_END=1513 /DNA_ORIENTATION=- /assembly_acc=CAM_ASM_000170